MFVDGSLLAAGACGGVAALAIITATPFLTRWFCATHTPAPPPPLISTTKKEEEAERTPPAEDIQGPHCVAVDELHNTQVVVEDHHPRTSPTVPTTRPVSWSSTNLPNHTTHHHHNNNNNTSIKSHNLCPSLGSSSSSILVYRPQDDMDRVAFAHLHHTDYVPLRRIGRGAFAVVYLVERRTDGRHFALKYVALSDERRRAMAFREGDLLSRVQGHAGIVAVEDIHLHYNFSPAHAQKQHPAAATTTTTTATASSSLVAAGGAGVVGQVPRTLRSSSTTITTTITTAGSVRNTQSGSVPPPRRGRATSTSTLPATPTPQPGAMLLLGESTPHMTANVVYDCGGDVERRDDEEEEDEEDDDEDVVLGLTTAAPLVSAGTAPAFDEDEATPHHHQQQQQVAPSPPCMIAPPPTTTTITTTPAAASISSPVASPSHTSAGDSIAARGAGFGSATALSNASFTSPTAAAPLYRNFSFRDGVDVRRAASSSALFPPPHLQLQQHQSSLPATSSSFADASMMMPRHGPSPLHFTNFTPADGGVGGSVEALNNSSMTMATAAVAAAAAGISSAAPPMMGAAIASASSLTNIPPPSMQFRECWRGGGSASVVEQRYLPHTSNVGVMHTPSPSSWHVGGDSSIIKDVAAPSPPPPTTTTTKTAGSPNTLLATLFGNLNEAVVVAASAAAAGTPTPTTTTTNTRPPPTPTDGECGATSTPSTTTTEVSTVAGESSVAGFMAIVTTFHECGDLASYVMRHDRRIPRRRRKPSSSHATATQTHAMEEVDEVADDEVAESGSALNKNAFTEPQLLSIAFQLANVLVHLHRQRPAVVHRDLKPENILLAPPTAPPRTSMMTMMASRTTRASDTGGESQDAAASVSPPHAHNTPSPPPPHVPCQRFTTSIIPIVVADFGLAMLSAEDRDLIPVNAIFGGDDGGDGVDGSSAHRLATSRSGKTLPRHTGIGGGTRPFISPESWRGQTCTASDVWSYGCVLYALATGRVTAARVRIMSREARSEGFATMVLNDVLEAGYSLELASFVVSLLITDPLKRPTAEMARRCFRSTTEEVCFDLHSPFFSNMLDL